MSRAAYRCVSFVLLLSIVLSLLPGTGPTPAATAATPAAPSAFEPSDAPRIPRPQAAQSTSLPASQAATARAQLGATHTASGALDGTYSQESVETHGYPGVIATTDTQPISTTTERYKAVEYTAPAGPFTHDALTFDYQAVFSNGSTGRQNYVKISVWDAVAGTWGAEYQLKNGSFPTSKTLSLSETNLALSLGVVPTRAAVRLRLRCLTGYSAAAIDTCQMSNLRFANRVPNWSRFGPGSSNNITTPWPRWAFQVGTTAPGSTITSQANPFLSIHTDGSLSGGSSVTKLFQYRSPLIKLPASSGVFTARARYAVDVKEPSSDPSYTASGATIRFVPLHGTSADIETLISIPDTTTSTLNWEQAANAVALRNDKLSGKMGWIELVKSVGWLDHVFALDAITLSLDGTPIPLPADQLLGKCACGEGGQPQHIVGDPVNTFSGAYYLQAPDLAATSSGPPLTFARSYVSLFADPARYPTTPLGPGWRHAFAETLTLSGPGSEANTIIYEAATGNRLRFYGDPQGVLSAAPGVRATLDKLTDPVLQQPVYLLRSSDQWRKIFDLQGRLIERRDPSGHRQTLRYSQTPGQISDGQLEQVTDLSSGRTLRFTYADYTGPRLTAVEQLPDQGSATTDQKRITFGYTPDGALAAVTDLRGGTTTYRYHPATWLLEGIVDPLTTPVLTNTYDLTTKRVTQQVAGSGLTTTYTYTTDPATGGPITTVQQWSSPLLQGPPLDVLEDHYRPDGTLEYQIRNGAFQRYTTFDASLAPAARVDGAGHTTRFVHTSGGLPTTIARVLDQSTALTTTARYDAAHQPTELVSPDGVTTTLTYDPRGNPIRSTVRGADGLQLTSIYTYTADNRLEAEQRPDGVVSRSTYDARGQVRRTVVNPRDGVFDPQRPDEDLITDYGYDAFGRLITTTLAVGSALARTDTTRYHADDTIAQTIQKYHDGVFDPQRPDEDLITTYGYDRLGRRVLVQDVLGRSAVAHYDAQGRLDWSARNLDPALLTFQGGLPTLPATPPSFDPARPDVNVVTRYRYDAQGRATFVTETGILTGTFDPATRTFSSATERTTRIEYDSFSRPVTVTLNYQPGQPIYDPATGTGRPDVNLQELTYYDGAGNVTWERDALGRWSHTQYDALGRPRRTIATYENGDPTTVDAANRDWTDGSDTDRITEHQYRPDGQPARSIQNVIDGQFSLTDLTADRRTDYQYDALGRPTTTIANVLAGSTRTDTNRASTTRYAPQTGRVQGQQDALGRWLSYRYDALSRVTATIQNCRAADGTPDAVDCSDPRRPSERNVRSQTRYDALGRVVETIDALGQVTRTEYDGVGRVITTIANYVPGAPADDATNVTTRTTYDALGQAVAVTDPTGAVTRTTYDALGRALATTDAAGRTTRSGYDATGIPRWQLTPDGRLTVMQVDGLGRVTRTIANYQNGTTDAADGTDRDASTTTTADAAGRQIATRDAAGRTTAFRFDLRDQLVQVIENQRADCTDPAVQPCNVTTRYTYDRAGNRTAITDARPSTRWLVYDAADRLAQDIDALSRVTAWEYNSLDQPTARRDPRGAEYHVTFTYDELGRRTGTSATALDAPISEQYDALGRRTQLQDGTGTTTFQYDALHRVRAVQQPGGTVGYSYTARGERRQLRYPSGATVDYYYTADGQVETVQEGATTLARSSYDGLGRLARVSRANGATTSYAYDGLGRLFDLTTRVQGELRSRYQYTLDRAGLRTGVVETFPAATSGPSTLLQSTPVSSPPIQTTAAQGLGRLAFVPNAGQTDRAVAFLARHQGGTLFLTPQGVTLTLPTVPQGAPQPISYDPAGTDPDLPAAQRHRATPPPRSAVRVAWLQANAQPTLRATGPRTGTVHDLRGKTAAAWRRNLPTYAGVTYGALYDGIDLHYDGTAGALKGTYTVAAGADPSQIRWRYAGATATRLDAAGRLVVTLPAPDGHTAPTLTEAAPSAWQDGPAGRTPVAVAYHLAADGSVGFTLGAYDATHPLTIDPTLTWSATLSGSSTDVSRGIAVDSAGASYLTGETASADFPQQLGVQPAGHHGGYDAFVTKLSPDGSRVLWQTFLGGSGDDWGQSIAVDEQGRAVIAGFTSSDTLATTSNAVQAQRAGDTDAFVTQLDASGSTLRYSSYLGGSSADVARRVALTADGHAVVGESTSANFPTTAGSWQPPARQGTCGVATSVPGRDAFVTRLDLGAPDGPTALRFSTCLGGSGEESAWGVAVAGTGAVVVTGITASDDLPVVNALDPAWGGSYDAFITTLSADGTTARFSTYLGSTAADYGRAVAVDAQDAIYLTGWSYSSRFPTTPGTVQPALAGEGDTFITKLSGDGSALHWSTFVGGSAFDYTFSLAVAADGTSSIAGWTSSTDLPTYRPLQASHAGPTGGTDLLLATLTPDGQQAHLVSYLGSSSPDSAWGIATAGTGSARVTGTTGAASFPGGAADPTGSSNALVVALDGLTTPGGEPALEQRRVSYRYDGVQRLTEATATPGTAYRYTYDPVGNRTEVWADGVRTQALSYDAANQVVGWTYNAAGNLRSDGTRTLTYDALSRLSSATASGSTTAYRYSGDGVLTSQTTSGSTTTYTQDVVAPLSQVLERSAGGSTTTYRYGHERFAEIQGSTRTWFNADALGSLRQTLTDAGVASTPLHYDPWGRPTAGSTPPTFGFTGELQDAVSGLVHLRARWYLPGNGAFIARDPFAGFPNQPYSLHPYQYGYSNPVSLTDPSGKCIGFLGGVDTLLCAAAAGAVIGAAIDYGSQVYQNYQDPTKEGWDRWTNVNGWRVVAAGAGGAVAGAVGFVAAPLLAGAFGGGFGGTIAAGMAEGAITAPIGQAVTNLALGCAWDTGLGWHTVFGGALGGGLGSALRVGAGTSFKTIRGWSSEEDNLLINSYGILTKALKRAGDSRQAHHLNQDAAFNSIIPTDDGLAVAIRGNAFTEPGTPHYQAHQSLEAWWNQFRGPTASRAKGARFGQTPTVREYNDALYDSMRAAGFTEREAQKLVQAARANQRAHSLAESQPIPRIPRQIYQKNP